MIKLKTNHLIFVILFVASVLRIHGLNSRDIWYDEALTISQASKGFIQIIKDVPTPIHYFIVHIFQLIKNDKIVMALPGVLLGVASVYLVYLLGSSMFDYRVGLLSAFLSTISPMLIEYSQQILFFSYFIFFSLLSCYFAVCVIKSLNSRNQIDYRCLTLFVVSCLLNVLTIMLALVITFILAVILAFHIAKANKVSSFDLRRVLLYLVSSIIVAWFVLSAIGSNGYSLFFSSIRLSLKEHVTLGYSLYNQLGSSYLKLSPKFFIAIFSWFSFGPFFISYLYILLFVVGTFFLFKNRHKFTFFVISIVLIPFMLLVTIKLNHWFEEKYIIYILPIYLIVVSYGLLSLLDLYASLKKYKFFILCGLCIVFFLFSLSTFGKVTSFGYSFPGHISYDWGVVARYINDYISPDSKIFVTKGNLPFFEYYLGRESIGTRVFEDSVLGSMSRQQIQEVFGSSSAYLVSVSSYEFTFLNSLFDKEEVRQVGNFNLTKLSISKSFAVSIQENYFSSFNNSEYLRIAERWQNLVNSRSLHNDQTKYADVSLLTPMTLDEAFIDYSLNVSAPAVLNLRYVMEPGWELSVSVGEDHSSLNNIYSSTSDQVGYYDYTAEVPAGARYLRFKFVPKYLNGLSKQKLPGLISFDIVSADTVSAVSENDFEFLPMSNDRKVLVYDSELDYIYSSKWRRHAIAYKGWLQTNDGSLKHFYGDPKDTSLIFKFSLPEGIHIYSIIINVAASYQDSFSISVGSDGITWRKLHSYDNNDSNYYKLIGNNFGDNELYLRFDNTLEIGKSSLKSLKIII